jgi:hypothetical protein
MRLGTIAPVCLEGAAADWSQHPSSRGRWRWEDCLPCRMRRIISFCGVSMTASNP